MKIIGKNKLKQEFKIGLNLKFKLPVTKAPLAFFIGEINIERLIGFVRRIGTREVAQNRSVQFK